MTDINNLITRARLIKNETVPSANTAERVGQLLEDIINTFGSATPTRKTIRQVYDESGRLQVLFACNGSCVLKYSASVSGRSWSDELYYTSTSYPTADTFFALTRQDFTESRYLGVPRGVCIPTKTVSAAPSVTYTFEVVYLSGSITWYDGDRLVSVSSEDLKCSKIASKEDLSAAINLTTSAAGYIYTDQNEQVSSLANNTLYTMNASAHGGAFTIPARNDYSGTAIFCYGDGVATLNGTDYSYTSGQTLVLAGGVVTVEDTANDYYTKAESDAQLSEIRDSIATVYKFKGSCAFASLPSSNRKTGDTYNVTDAFTLGGVSYPAGTNVSWDGSAWDALAGDMSSKEDKANKVTSISSSSTDAQYPTAKLLYTLLQAKADDNAVVHKTGDESVDGWKTLQTGIVVGNSGYIRFTPPGTAGASIKGGTNNTLTVEGGGIIASSGNILNNESRLVTGGKVYTVLLDYQTLANLVTALSSSSTDAQYPSAKCMFDALSSKANDNGVVHKTGDESIAGVKSFTDTMKFGSGSEAIDLVKNGNFMELRKATIFRLQRVYTNSERHIALNVYGSVEGSKAYPRLVAQIKDTSGDEPVTTETTSVALRDDKVSFALNRTTEWGFVNATSNSNENWNTKEIPTKAAVAAKITEEIASANEIGAVNESFAQGGVQDITLAQTSHYKTTYVRVTCTAQINIQVITPYAVVGDILIVDSARCQAGGVCFRPVKYSSNAGYHAFDVCENTAVTYGSTNFQTLIKWYYNGTSWQRLEKTICGPLGNVSD